ncbi:hypothetical protein DVS28_b0242 (plasmid) [Euzebya pacifica]|uniref:Uncharacterized protein n=1 Tax=Euzebya pacifica TaxID=1608957 RepID=A0A346Y6B5_9ACTN|nr:hypothetical protein [Euzebya pacifica]AXV10012.1 hypothetical protein DVS28_b0242 [Euzebya pacifica]
MSTWAVGSNQHKKVPAATQPPVAAPHAAAAAGSDPMSTSAGRQGRIEARNRLNEAIDALSGGNEDAVLATLHAADDADHALGAAAAHYPPDGTVECMAGGPGPPLERAAIHLRAAAGHLRGRSGMDDHDKASALLSARARIGAARELLAPLIGG